MPIKNTQGEMSSRHLLIVGALTLFAALVIIIAFIVAANRQKSTADPNVDLLDLVRQRQEAQSQTNQAPSSEAEVELASYRGVLAAVNNNLLTVIEAETQATRTFALTDATGITYNGQPFPRSRLHPGDALVIDARSVGQDLIADRIIVIISASPETPAPTPPAPNMLPDGTIKPL